MLLMESVLIEKLFLIRLCPVSPGHRSSFVFIQAGLAHQKISADFDILEGERIAADWEAFGGSLSIGVELPITEKPYPDTSSRSRTRKAGKRSELPRRSCQ